MASVLILVLMNSGCESLPIQPNKGTLPNQRGDSLSGIAWNSSDEDQRLSARDSNVVTAEKRYGGVYIPPTTDTSPKKISLNQRPARNRPKSKLPPIVQGRGSQPFRSQSVAHHHLEQFQTARRFEQDGQWDAAVNIYETLIREGDETAPILHRLAVAYDQTGQTGRSLPLYERARRLDPSNADLLCDQGYHAFLTGDIKGAKQLYQLALDRSPNHSRSHNNLAVLLAQGNDRTQALQHFSFAGLAPEQAKHNMQVALRSNPSSSDRLIR